MFNRITHVGSKKNLTLLSLSFWRGTVHLNLSRLQFLHFSTNLQLATGNLKLETGNPKLETGNSPLAY